MKNIAPDLYVINVIVMSSTTYGPTTMCHRLRKGGGILTESCDALTTTCDDNGKQFKGIFLRYVADLNSVTGNAYATFAATQSHSIWTSDRDSENRLGERWSGQTNSTYPNAVDWRTQASALSGLLASPPPV
jgi:hypothetical protein